jgi:hypothetical protein
MAENLLSGHHRATAERLFAHPTSHNVEWHDVMSLLSHVGTVVEEHNHRYIVTIGDETETFDRPQHDDVDTQQIVDLRRMLTNAGITPPFS